MKSEVVVWKDKNWDEIPEQDNPHGIMLMAIRLMEKIKDVFW